MGKKVKTGKSRRDKYYRLAAETGYRSRSAFKLIQLNRRFQFLQKARVLIDLCAAPGGWLQVASKFMPISSVIIGVDLVPIKSIPNVVTLQEDITTEKCRQALRKELQTWKVDIVLNDGAPNVGANWIHDAFSQAHLALMALRLASEFLHRGGTFITKVFRSQDYQALLWVFKQLFRKVQASKPQASRSESAEIFVVCQSYLAPDKIDSKFFDPKYIFQQIEVPAKSVRDLVTSKKPKVEGYVEGDYTLYHRSTLMDFIKAQNAVDFLDHVSEITFDNSELEHHKQTTPEIRECCKDIRVLGRKELRSLLNWRNKLRKYLAKELREQAKDVDLEPGSGEDGEDVGGVEEGEEELGEEEQLEEQLASLKSDELAELKRKKRKILKERRKQRERDELKMDLPGVSIADEADISLFSLKPISSGKLKEFEAVDMQTADETVPGLDVSSEAIDTSQRSHQRRVEIETDPLPQREVVNPLLVELESWEIRKERQTNLWFSKDVFSGIDSEGDEVLEIEHTDHLCLEQSGGEREGERSEAVKTLEEGKEETLSGEKEGSDDETSSDESEIKDMKKSDSAKVQTTAEEGEEFQIVPARKCARVLDAEGLSLATAIATSRKRRRDIVDDSFNRYAFDDPQGLLPDWFVDNEEKYRRRPLPFDPAMAAEFRQRWREINARPIKKIAEAKARKKRRFLKKLEQVKRKAEAVVNTVDTTEKEKMVQMRSIYKKAKLGRENREVTYVVSKRGGGSGGGRRPPGVKGKYKVVDSRMKKDLRRKGGREGKGRQRGRK